MLLRAVVLVYRLEVTYPLVDRSVDRVGVASDVIFCEFILTLVVGAVIASNLTVFA